MLLALAFVPVVDVIKAFELVANNVADDDDDNNEFLDYFGKTWIGEPKKRGKLINKKINTQQAYLATGRKKLEFPIEL